MGESAVEVLVAGQIARDLVVVVPEVPAAGSSAEVVSRHEMLGGKGANIAVAAAQLGATASVLGVVGDDLVADHLLRRLKSDHVDPGAVVRRTGAKTALMIDLLTEAGHWRYLEDVPEAVLLTRGDVRAAEGRLRTAACVVVQLQQPAEAALAAAECARTAGRKVVLDGVPADDETRTPLLAAADVLRLDQHEAELLARQPIDSPEAALQAGRALLGRGPSLVAIAAGEAGNVFVQEDDQWVLPLTGGDAVDTTGGGDAFVAALAVSLARGAAPHRAAKLAVAASGATVEHPGGRPDLRLATLAPHLRELSGR